MQIQISGDNNMEVTPELKELTINKFDRVLKHSDRITHIQVIFNREKLSNIAEAIIQLPGAEIHAKSESDHIEKTLHDLVEKLLRQITKYKEKHTMHRE